MFIGHYAAALALKPAAKQISLFWLMIAATFIDLAFAVFNLAGLEQVRIVPGFTETNALDLAFYPYSHSLLAALLWSFAVYLIVRLVPLVAADFRPRAALVMGLAVFSHWVLDLLVHVPDLPLAGNDTSKLGLGLWNNAAAAFGVEAGLYLLGLFLYLRSTQAISGLGRWGILILSALLVLLLYVSSFSGEVPPSVNVVIVSGLIMNLLMAVIMGWLDRKRISIAA